MSHHVKLSLNPPHPTPYPFPPPPFPPIQTATPVGGAGVVGIEGSVLRLLPQSSSIFIVLNTDIYIYMCIFFLSNMYILTSGYNVLVIISLPK